MSCNLESAIVRRLEKGGTCRLLKFANERYIAWKVDKQACQDLLSLRWEFRKQLYHSYADLNEVSVFTLLA